MKTNDFGILCIFFSRYLERW